MYADGLSYALRSTGPDGVCTSIGIYLRDTAVPLFQMYLNGVSFRTGRGHARPAIPALIELVAAGRLRPELVTSQVADWGSALEALSDPPRKLVLARGLSSVRAALQFSRWRMIRLGGWTAGSGRCGWPRRAQPPPVPAGPGTSESTGHA